MYIKKILHALEKSAVNIQGDRLFSVHVAENSMENSFKLYTVLQKISLF